MDDQTRKLELAEKIKTLFLFADDLNKDIDLLEDLKAKGSRADYAMTMAPIIGAMGGDYEVAVAKGNMEDKRLDALLNLIKVLHDTEKEYKKAKQDQQKKKEALGQLGNIF